MIWSRRCAEVPPARRPAAAPLARHVLASGDISFAIATAGRAPSIHNTQPWKFRADGEVIELFADPERKLPLVDPAGRELMISCGAALFGLRLAYRKLGYLADVQVLPDPANHGLIATVRPGGRATLTSAEAELLAAVPHRHTHRGPFVPGEVAARLLGEMQADAAAESCQLLLIDDRATIVGLGKLVARAAAQQRADAGISAELQRWVPAPDRLARDGVPARARTGLPGAGTPLSLPPRDFGQPGSEQAGGPPPAATAVLWTAGDTAPDWLHAGQALHRLLLHAATRWVFASLQSQPLESPRNRREVRKLTGLAGYPHMLLQFGRANTAAATPRRPVGEVWTDEGL
jgi:hypothetical protein